MTEPRERRTAPRITLSGQTTVRTHTGHVARLLDLSLHGVRLGHQGLLRVGAPCALDLPAALGGAVRGHVVWCTIRGVEPTGDGASALWASSGVQFAPLRDAQETVLGQALRDLAGWMAAPTAPVPTAAGEALLEPHDRRAQPRTPLATRPAARVPGLREVRLFDLSPAGAQIEHLYLVRLGSNCTLELLPPFGVWRLPAQVVWCTIVGRKQKLGGDSYLVARSGLSFTRPTPAQHAMLAGILHGLATTPQPIA
jgi:PilZ domain